MTVEDFMDISLKEEDLEIIDEWRKMTLSYEGVSFKNIASIKTILIPWADAKSHYLFNLLGEKLIISKHIKIKQSEEDLIKEFSRKKCIEYYNFERVFMEAITSNNQNEAYCFTFNFSNKLFSFCSVIRNLYEGETIILKNQKNEYFKLQKGMKLMKAYKNLLNFYKLNNYLARPNKTMEQIFLEIRNLQSQVCNQAYLEGELSLSIHPLDYMTMSDNNCGWSSCMQWGNGGGDYRQGTIEMMNSPGVIVAYLEAKHPFTFGDCYTWTNKKWRQLFIVDPSCIAAIKAYPYQNDNLTIFILNWLTELAKTNLNWEYLPSLYNIKDNHSVIYNDKNEKTFIDADFYTSYMYNDFGTLPKHYLKLKTENKDINITYSGPSECMFCGKTNIDLDDNAERIVCYQCGENPYYCCECGTHLREDEFYCFDDYDTNIIYCAECFDAIGGQVCARCGNRVHTINQLPVYIIENENADTLSLKEILTYTKSENVINTFICNSCMSYFCKYPDRYLTLKKDKDDYLAAYTNEQQNFLIFIVKNLKSYYQYVSLKYEDLGEDLPENLVDETLFRIY